MSMPTNTRESGLEIWLFGKPEQPLQIDTQIVFLTMRIKRRIMILRNREY